MDSSDDKALAEIRLKWYDDSTLFTDDGHDLLRQFLKSLGITAKSAFEVFHILLMTHKAGVKISAREVHEQVINFRRRMGDSDRKGLTLRNIQVWLKYFQDIGFLDNVQDKYMFKAARNPVDCFNEYTTPIIDSSMNYTRRVLEKMEKAYGLK